MTSCTRARRPAAQACGHPWLAGLAGLALAGALLGGCALTPAGAGAEQARLAKAGERFERPLGERSLPELPEHPGWENVLHRAFLANGELEAAYFDWKASDEQIGIASAYPNTNLMLGYSVALGPGGMKTFDRMTFSAGTDTMENLSFPTKVAKAGEVALAEARAAGERFRAMKFDLQRRVLSTWADYLLATESARIERQDASLARSAFDTATARVSAGGAQGDLLKAEVALRTAEDRLRNADAQVAVLRASLNGLMARAADTPLPPPERLPDPRAMPTNDAVLIAAGVSENPELAALAHQVEGRADALELARMRWIPDINPSIAFTGGIGQAIGAAIMLPTTVAEIRGGIREAEAMERSSQATLRQAAHDRAASFVATLVMLRNSEREAALFEQSVLPSAERILTTVRQSYSAGKASYLDLIDAQRGLLETRLTIARARMEREKRLAELEALAGTDIETLERPAASPGVQGTGASQ